MVGEFIQCGVNTGYHVIQFMTVLDFDSSQQPINYAKGNVVIQNRTPYLIKNRDPLCFSFALGNNVSLCCVIVLLDLLVLGGIFDLVKGTLFVLNLIEHFLLF